MKFLRYFLHLLQAGLCWTVYLMDDLYKNHLGFMRNVSFYSHKLETSMFGSKLFLLPLLLSVIALFLIIKKRDIENFLLFGLAVVFLIWQSAFSIAVTPIYYLVSGILFLGSLFQLIIVLLKRSSSHGLLGKNN